MKAASRSASASWLAEALVVSALLLLALFVRPAASAGSVAGARPDLVLLTLDTVRADELGAYGGAAKTPELDRLATAGVRFARALTPVPLTLPAHASLLTGLDPNEHGLRDNGAGGLPKAAPTIAAELAAAGYATVAVVGSRVLDRRFGLDRGFDLYDDRMVAERVGEYGYAERPGREVVDALLVATRRLDPSRPWFLWAHFYDAHSPYLAPGANERERYRREIELVDGEVGRLLASLPAGRARWVVIAGDHGESFGEHGEEEHGYLLHEPTLAVPLIVVGPAGADVPRGAVRAAPIGTRRIAATLAALAGLPASSVPGPPLLLDRDETESPIYHETEFPASTFGWSPLVAVTRGAWRLVEGPKLALYDLRADPGEATDRSREATKPLRALRADLRRFQARAALVQEPVAPDAELAKALESLGYLSGATAKRGTLDPSDGVKLLDDLKKAKLQLAAGDVAGARAALRALVAKSPGSVPFLAQLAAAERAAGDRDAARAALAAALAANPRNDFMYAHLGQLETEAGRPEAAVAAYRKAVEINPRFASAWVSLGELLSRLGRPSEEEAALHAAVAAECESGVVFARLAEVELARGDLDGADQHARRATELLPSWPPAWRLWAAIARRQGRPDLAAEREARARQ